MIALDSRYDQQIARLALGIEPVDAQRGTRVTGRLTVTFDECPRPLHLWRAFPRGVHLDDVLPRMTRHESGRYARVYDDKTPAQLAVRLSDPSRRYVPRRLRIAIPTEVAVETAEADDAIPDVPITNRSLQIHMHPGANAEISAAATVLRGQILSGGAPLPWCRVRADDVTTGLECGFAHGDDRGEFVLPIRVIDDSVEIPPDQVDVRLTVGFRTGVMPPPDDPLVPTVDPLWKLVEETTSLPVAAPVPPATGDVANGRTFPASFAVTTFVTPFTIRTGQVRSVLLTLP